MAAPTLLRAVKALFAVAAGLALLSVSASAQPPPQPRAGGKPRLSLVLPMVDAARGRKLFVTKGCFICHSVRGVGGKAAPALDAPTPAKAVDVVGFVARMWKGAPIMFKLQAMELGYRIELGADDFADLAGFVTDTRAQEGFSMREIPEIVREWVVDEAWWNDPAADFRDRLPERFPDLDGRDAERP